MSSASNPAAVPGPRSLREAIPRFFQDRGTKLIALFLVGSLIWRFVVGGVSIWGLLIPAFLVMLQPFMEWMIHVYLLHMRPRKLFGFTIDPLAARMHRAHHREPWKTALGFMPFPVLVQLLIGETLLWSLLPLSPAVALRGAVATFGLTFYYEWIHFLVHTPYLPKGAFYREQWRLHRLHHH